MAALGDKNPGGDEIINRLEIPVGKGITGAVAQSQSSIVINDLGQDERYSADLGEANSEICVPTIWHGPKSRTWLCGNINALDRCATDRNAVDQ